MLIGLTLQQILYFKRFLTVVATSILCTGVLNFASRVVTVTVPIYIIFATSVTETLPLTTTITTTIYADIAIPVCYITTLILANTNTTLCNRSCYWLWLGSECASSDTLVGWRMGKERVSIKKCCFHVFDISSATLTSSSTSVSSIIE